MKNYFVFLFMLLPLLSFSQYQMQVLPVAETGRFEDIFFVNEHLGFMIGGDSMAIYKTTDGGLNWQIKKVLDSYPRSIEFLDAQVGFCGTLGSRLYKTTDSGETWTDISSVLPKDTFGICGLAIPTGTQTIYGVGTWTAHTDIFKSTDGGNTWTYYDVFPAIKMSHLIDVYFTDAYHGFITGMFIDTTDHVGGGIAYTSDGGSTWTVVASTGLDGDRVWKIFPLDSLNYYASIESGTLVGSRYLKSTDGGQTWALHLAHSQDLRIQMIGFMDTLHGFMGGHYGPPLVTTDGGQTWDFPPPEVLDIGMMWSNRFFKVNDSLGFFAARKPVRVFREELGWLSAPEIETEGIPSPEIFPNPVADRFHYRLTSLASTSLELTVFNLDGKMMHVEIRKLLSGGEHNGTFDMTGFPVGPYIVKLQTNEHIYYARLLKI